MTKREGPDPNLEGIEEPTPKKKPQPEKEEEVNPWDNQVLLIDKPLRWTSFDVVKKAKRSLRVRKIGHAGTLDPLATGLLILCTGKQTKQINIYQDAPKQYLATLKLGITTPSFDLETEPVASGDYTIVTREMLEDSFKPFLGDTLQIPPAYSAIKMEGERVFLRARLGEEVKMRPRAVTIMSIELLSFVGDEVVIDIHCSKGTYVRSLAHDIGQALGCGAALSALRRTAIGEFKVEDAMLPMELQKKAAALHAAKMEEQRAANEAFFRAEAGKLAEESRLDAPDLGQAESQ